MMNARIRYSASIALMTALICFGYAAKADGDLPPLKDRPTTKLQAAEPSTEASHVQILGATRAGKRLVAVGDHGVVLLSDDNGKTFRQAHSVPFNGSLTSVSFADERKGWAVGHWGIVLRTQDGGETWSIQRRDMSVDQPLFGIYFQNVRTGWAVGLWSLLLHTEDGGLTWNVVRVPAPPGAKKADRNFYGVFGDDRGNLYIPSEQGLVVRSSDNGSTWTYAKTGYEGSFWAGAALRDGALIVGGLRGTVYRSTDGGNSWVRSTNDYKSSITSFAQGTKGAIVASSLDGVVLMSLDNGVTFKGSQRTGRESLTAVVDTTADQPVLFSASGVVY